MKAHAFTNPTIFTIGGELIPFDELAEAMGRQQFAAPLPTQDTGCGWVPARGIEHGALLENVGGHWIALMQVEDRMLPASVVKRLVQQKADKLHEQTGRRPKGKALRELKEEARHELLPQAFTRIRTMHVWIDPKRKLLVIDSPSAKRSELVMKFIAACAPEMNLHWLRTTQDAGGVITAWVLAGEAEAPFELDRHLELRGSGENPPSVTFSGMEADAEVRTRIEVDGMRVARVALAAAHTADSATTLTLHGSGAVRGVLVPLASLMDPEKDVDAWDGTIAILTGTLGPLFDDLIAALGGIAELPIEQAAKSEAAAEEPEGEPA